MIMLGVLDIVFSISLLFIVDEFVLGRDTCVRKCLLEMVFWSFGIKLKQILMVLKAEVNPLKAKVKDSKSQS
jgi:hypothetical protein